ncbi:unnamed protein product [Vicia faba]|uniref:Uncharacterized protein n=1 Tax=Vicia faba TaxID=3906 RepID=A0AAV1A6U8_VICFA|nr:unnamed protein product [Vicia faba]
MRQPLTNKAVKEDIRYQLRSDWCDHKSLALMNSLRPLVSDAHNTMVEIFSMGEYLGYLGAIYGLVLESNLTFLAQQHEFLSQKHTLTTTPFHHNVVGYTKLPLAAAGVKTFSFNCEVEGFFCSAGSRSIGVEYLPDEEIMALQDVAWAGKLEAALLNGMDSTRDYRSANIATLVPILVLNGIRPVNKDDEEANDVW